jgi:membrane fusion protein, multidrug efflux system
MDDLNTQRQAQEENRLRRAPAPVKRPVRRRILWIGAILLVALALVWWIHHGPAQSVPKGRFANSGTMPVVAATVTQGDINIIDNALGTVTALATVTVQTQINGQLTEVGFKEGQDVKKGDFLAQIDPRPYQAALDQAQGQLLKDQASLKMAQMDLARYQKLAAQNSIAKQQSEDQVYVVGQDQGTVALDQAQVENAKLNLAYCHIVAPVSGRIGLRLVDPGNYVQASSTTGIAVIAQMQPISVLFTLPEDQLPAVMTQLHSSAKLSVTINDRSDTIKLATGTLSALDSQIDTTTGTVKLRAQFDNEDESLFPNQFVNAHLLVSVLHGVTVIPTSAIQRGAPGTFVYLIKPDETVGVENVTLGPEDNGMVQVVSGLASGNQVVVDGADKLREGSKIVLRQEAAPATATPSNAAQPSSPQSPPASDAPPGQPTATPNQTPPNQTQPTQPNQTQPNQTQPNQTQPNQTQGQSSDQHGQRRHRNNGQ